MAKLYFYYSAMNAGKSTTLLQSSYNYQERGMRTLIFTPNIDTRFGIGKVTSRIGLKAEAIPVDKYFDLLEYVKSEIDADAIHPLKCILIDEAQFLTKEQVKQLGAITIHCNIPVLAYGLRADFMAEPFEGSLYLLALADELMELKTICHCGSKATMNMRIDENYQKISAGAQVEIGGNDRYVATCRKHYELGVARSKEQIAMSAIEPAQEELI